MRNLIVFKIRQLGKSGRGAWDTVEAESMYEAAERYASDEDQKPEEQVYEIHEDGKNLKISKVRVCKAVTYDATDED